MSQLKKCIFEINLQAKIMIYLCGLLMEKTRKYLLFTFRRFEKHKKPINTGRGGEPSIKHINVHLMLLSLDNR